LFEIINVDTNEVVSDVVFATGQEANNVAKEMGSRFKPRPIVNDSWKAREQARFKSGEYKKLLWSKEELFPKEFKKFSAATTELVDNYFNKNITVEEYSNSYIQLRDEFLQTTNPQTIDHFAHTSIKDPTRIAFTPTAEMGMVDRQTAVTPGVYLTRFYSDYLTSEQIKKLAIKHSSTYEDSKMEIARTGDEIENVYVNGPNSCMAHPADQFLGNVHPCRAYESEDLGIAFIRNKNNTDRIAARALVNVKEKVYSRIYGDADRFSKILSVNGYRPDSGSDFNESKMAKIKVKIKRKYDNVLIPYLDGDYEVTDCGDYLIMDTNGELSGESSNGVLYGSIATCYRCDESLYSENDIVRLYTGRYNQNAYCSSCADRTNSFTCVGTGEQYAEDYVRKYEVDGQTWSRFGLEEAGYIYSKVKRKWVSEAEYQDIVNAATTYTPTPTILTTETATRVSNRLRDSRGRFMREGAALSDYGISFNEDASSVSGWVSVPAAPARWIYDDINGIRPAPTITSIDINIECETPVFNEAAVSES